MAGTDNTTCSQCGEGWFDRADRVGSLCPLCWDANQLAIAAHEAEVALDAAKERLAAKRSDIKDRETEAKKPKAKASA